MSVCVGMAQKQNGNSNGCITRVIRNHIPCANCCACKERLTLPCMCMRNVVYTPTLRMFSYTNMWDYVCHPRARNMTHSWHFKADKIINGNSWANTFSCALFAHIHTQIWYFHGQIRQLMYLYAIPIDIFMVKFHIHGQVIDLCAISIIQSQTPCSFAKPGSQTENRICNSQNF